jgi:hypothetical protein
MPFFHKIDKERRLVMGTAAGEFTKADVLLLQDQLRKDPDFDPNFSLLSDLSHVTSMDITEADMKDLAERTPFSPSARRAVLASNDLSFKLAQVFEQVLEKKGDQGIRVFRKLEDALDWIVVKDGPA